MSVTVHRGEAPPYRAPNDRPCRDGQSSAILFNLKKLTTRGFVGDFIG
jgi:hypothetical protein